MKITDKRHGSAEKEPAYPLHRRLDGQQSRSGRFGEEEKRLLLLGVEYRTTHPITYLPFT
jgi:hypothetical protein